MKTNNRKILQLINHGFSGSLLSDLNEGQINSLYKRLVESITTNDPKKALELNKMDPNANVQLTTETDDFEVYEDTDSEMEWVMKGDTQDPIQKGPTGDGDPDSLQEYKNLAEKFESKKQQKYFFAKCGDGKTKEQKKWCKMAEEFAEKTNFKKLPEKKKETKEGYMDMVGGAITKANLKNLNQISPSVSMGENELERKIMKLVEKHITPKMSKKDFLSLVSEQETKPKIKEPITKPNEPSTPYSPKPGPKKAPKAHKREFDEQETKPKIKEPITKPNEPSTPYSPKPGPKKAPKASKGKLPSWLSFKSIGIKLK
jgi:hypothetical protein